MFPELIGSISGSYSLSGANANTTSILFTLWSSLGLCSGKSYENRSYIT